MSSNKWVKVHTVESIFEMDVLKDALDREGIEYVVKEHKDTAYDGLFILQKGYATFFVREKDEAAAKAVIQQIKKLPYVVFSKD
jgi:hypothetical protein